MKISYNVSGSERKKLASAISQEMNETVKYLGAPSFAYVVGGYTVDRDGVLQGEDNLGLVADLHGLHEFRAVNEEYDTPLPEAEPVDANVAIPYEAALGGRVSPYRDYEEPPAYDQPENDDSNRLTIELPKASFTDTAIENLKQLVNSKESLIKKALGVAELPIVIQSDTIQFPWFPYTEERDKVKAYTHFVTALCELAKELKRVNATAKEVDNEKYVFRCFLLRLGFIGKEYKTERKVLLSKLTGSSAFRNTGEVEE